MKNLFLPTPHLSYSSMRLLITNAAMFKKRYIDRIWDAKKSPALVEGSAVHQVLADFYQWTIDKSRLDEVEFNVSEAVERAVESEIINRQSDVDWGKTGSLEKSIETVKRVVGYYFEDKPLHHPHEVEQSYTAVVHDPAGNKMPLPLKGKVDLVATTSDGELYIVDHKAVKTFSNPNKIKPEYQLQAVAYYLIYREFSKVDVAWVQIDEIKKSARKAKDGNVQSIKVEITDELIDLFFILYKRVINHLSVFNKLQPLPNVFDFLDGEETWEDFQSECKYIAKHKQ